MVRKAAWIVLLCLLLSQLVGCSDSEEGRIMGVWKNGMWQYDFDEGINKLRDTGTTVTFTPYNEFYSKYNGDVKIKGTYFLEDNTLTMTWEERLGTRQIAFKIIVYKYITGELILHGIEKSGKHLLLYRSE